MNKKTKEHRWSVITDFILNLLCITVIMLSVPFIMAVLSIIVDYYKN